MLVLKASRLVFLANPKTATQSVRAMLKRFATEGSWTADAGARHGGIGPFNRKWRAEAEALAGGAVEVFAVVREPVARLDSWYRYRQKNPAGDRRSTQGMGFEAFVEAVLADPVPDFARVGAQDRFVGWDGRRAAVDVLFDYEQLGLMMEFLADRIGQRLHLPMKNISPVPRGEVPVLSASLMARLREAWAGEFALYEAVRETGVLFADD